jgi:translation elongation factor EF-Ts
MVEVSTVTGTESLDPDVLRAVELLGDADPEVRLASAIKLGERQALAGVPGLVDRLGAEREFFIREAVTWALLRMTEEALPHVRRALRDPRWVARMRAAHVLSKLGRRADAELLLPLVHDEVDAVAARAYWAAGQTGNPLVVPALVGELGRGDSEHRTALSGALAELGDVAVPALVAALGESEAPHVRRHAADTLALMGSPGADRAALALAEAARGSGGEARLAALNALGQLRPAYAGRVVAGFADSADPLMRRLASRLVERRGGRAAGRTAGRDDRPVPRTRSRPTGHGPGEGMVAAAPGVLVEVRCESDLVAKSPTLAALAEGIAGAAAERPDLEREALLGLEVDGHAVGAALAELGEASGESVVLGSVVRLPGRTAAYLPRVADGHPPRVGALVAYEGGVGTDDVVRSIALQVAVCAPRHLTRADVPPEALAAAYAEAARAASAAGKPQGLVSRIAAGKVEQLVHESVLMEQVSVADPGRVVKDLLYGKGVKITGFARLHVANGSPGDGSPPP